MKEPFKLAIWSYVGLGIVLLFIVTQCAQAEEVFSNARIIQACQRCLEPLVAKRTPLKTKFVSACKLCSRSVIAGKIELADRPMLIAKDDASLPRLSDKPKTSSLLSDREMLSLIERGKLNNKGEIIIDMYFDEVSNTYKITK